MLFYETKLTSSPPFLPLKKKSGLFGAHDPSHTREGEGGANHTPIYDTRANMKFSLSLSLLGKKRRGGKIRFVRGREGKEKEEEEEEEGQFV